MEQLLLTKTHVLSSEISRLLYKTHTIAVLVIEDNDPEMKNFEKVAARVMDDPSIKNVTLAPDGIVSKVYPFQGNEAVIGLDYFTPGIGNREAVTAKETGQLVLAGPIDLKQGGKGLKGIRPVYLKTSGGKEKFWGFVSVTLNYPQILERVKLVQLESQEFAYELWRINPDTNQKQIIAKSDCKLEDKMRCVEESVSFLNTEWHIKLAPMKEWDLYPEVWLFLTGGTLLSFLLAFLVFQNDSLCQMKAELEVLTAQDVLTGILNRRGMFQAIDKLLSLSSGPFVLCYLDLDKFKMINDTFGHNAGDKILRRFSDVVKKNLGREHLFSRIGGDEFVIVFLRTDQKKEVNIFFERLDKRLRKISCFGLGDKVGITFSMGMAVYPEDGNTVEELITFADQNMYKEKSKKTKC